MTPRRPPTWREVETFLRIDVWTEVRRTGHVFYEKTLADGSILQTHRSLAGDKAMGDGRFRLILRLQLLVTAAEFWEALRSETAVPRPSAEAEPAPRSLPLWLVIALERDVGLTQRHVEMLDEEEARVLLDGHRSRPR